MASSPERYLVATCMLALAACEGGTIIAPDASFDVGTRDVGMDGGVDTGPERVDVDAGTVDGGMLDVGLDVRAVQPDTGPQPRTSEDLLWIYDGELGAHAGVDVAENGGHLSICQHHPEEALQFVEDDSYGNYLVNFHMEADWQLLNGTRLQIRHNMHCSAASSDARDWW